MRKTHDVRINVVRSDKQLNIIEGRNLSIPRRLFNKIFKNSSDIVVIAPSSVVGKVEIFERKEEVTRGNV